MTLPKRSRLAKKRDIDKVFKEGKTVRGSFFFMRALKNSLGKGRIVITVSKSVTQRAVDRNRTRRVLSNVLAYSVKTLPMDVVVVVTGSILEKEYEEIKAEIDEGIKQLMVK